MSYKKPLILQAKAFLKMIEWLGTYSNFNRIPRQSWVEAIGIMFCRETADKYVIIDAEGQTSGNLVYVQSNPQQDLKIIAYEEQLITEDPNIFQGGWFHSHPGHGLFYSGTDTVNQDYWQTMNPNGVGLVFDLTKVSATNLGFKFFRLDYSGTDSYDEVDYELYGFTEKTLIDAFEPIGIEMKTIHELAKHLNLEMEESTVEFDKIEIPQTAEPIGFAKLCIAEGRKVYVQGNINKALEKFHLANILLKDADNPEDLELYTKASLKLAKYCVFNEFFEQARSLLREVIVFTKRMKLNPDLYVGKAQILFGYLKEFNNDPEDALDHYTKALNHFKLRRHYFGLYKANDLIGGISWKFNNQDDAKRYFKDALYNAMMAEKASPDKKAPVIWNLIKKGISTKISNIESTEGQPA